MAFGIPDFLRYDLRHRIERFQDGVKRGNLRTWINDSLGLVLAAAVASALLLVVAVVWALWPNSAPLFRQGKTAWFYDMNTGSLFIAHSKQAGPIAAPSGPAPSGELVGFRVHVYSYVLDPNESELFVGFLERPDPNSGVKAAASDTRDFQKWAQSRLIRRVDDKAWVRAASPEGQTLLQELTRPNESGQTPLYQMPGD